MQPVLANQVAQPGMVAEAAGAVEWVAGAGREHDRGDPKRGRRGGSSSAYWKKASRTKRKSQNTPMVCQYQAVQSTRIWRLSSSREA